jgi:hypothetical protein
VAADGLSVSVDPDGDDGVAVWVRVDRSNGRCPPERLLSLLARLPAAARAGGGGAADVELFRVELILDRNRLDYFPPALCAWPDAQHPTSHRTAGSIRLLVLSLQQVRAGGKDLIIYGLSYNPPYKPPYK